MVHDFHPERPRLRFECVKPQCGTTRIGRPDCGPAGVGPKSFPARLDLPSASVVFTVAIGLAIALLGHRGPVRAQEAKTEKPGKRGWNPGPPSLLVVVRQRPEKHAPPQVVLSRPAEGGLTSEKQPEIRPDILPRELVRQAILIAARDELGLSTRDEVIDDSSAQGQGEGRRPPPWKSSRLSATSAGTHGYHRAGKDQTKHLVNRETQISHERDPFLLNFLKAITVAEALSREEFPKVLKGLGLDGKPNERKERTEPELPKYAKARLSTLGFSQTLVAIRDLHQAIRTKGETPAAVGALVRGYASSEFSASSTGTPPIWSSRPGRYCTPSGWWRGAQTNPGDFGTAPSLSP